MTKLKVLLTVPSFTTEVRSHCIDFSVSGTILLKKSPNDFLSCLTWGGTVLDLYQENNDHGGVLQRNYHSTYRVQRARGGGYYGIHVEVA